MLRIFEKQIFRNIRNGRRLNTWSHLATAFNSAVSDENHSVNILKKETGLFGIPELKSEDGFNILKSRALAHVDVLIDEAINKDRKRKMVEIFDELSNTLCKVADMAEFIRVAHPDQQYVQAAEDACITISGVVEKLNTHRELYDVLKKVATNGDTQVTSDIDNHVAKLFLFDFEQCGIHLPERQRRKVVKLNDYILQVGQRFMGGAVTPRTVDADALPDVIRQYFVTDNGQILVQGFYTDSSNTAVREAAYKLFLFPDKEQDYLLHELLSSRHLLAEYCEFPSYAHRAVKGSTVESPVVVKEFLNVLNDNLQSKATQDFQEMQKMKDAESHLKQELMPWDTAYFMAKAKKVWLNTSTTEFAPYFSLGACMEGLNILTQSLYGVRLESIPVLSGEVWANNVHKLAVIDEEEGILGYIYCDFYERMGKSNQDCHFTIQGGKQLPDSSYQHVTGTRCSTDFAEVPSVLMEYFASDPRVVSKFAKHFQTQEPMPENLLHKLCASKNIFCASELQNQVFYSMLDQVYHSGKLTKSTSEILADVQKEYYGLPYVKNTAWQLRFSHLVGYGAKYYSYLISRAIAAWIWQTYFHNDPFCRSAGNRYRKECLAHGGGKPASQLVSDFLNKEATAATFAKSLINEVDMKNLHMETIKQRNSIKFS
ncbi:mitochondrial intermediate peptidase isoform X2 [Formica exsecta]|uniref:mitochondrial intermediate peptidase isoform X2 n=1 Tax=Formica exsecta TaxID=72781 RepID=UPI001141F53A|nr:mitochondrial intermediate peptidase isoform X2 [Formica exsecta]